MAESLGQQPISLDEIEAQIGGTWPTQAQIEELGVLGELVDLEGFEDAASARQSAERAAQAVDDSDVSIAAIDGLILIARQKMDSKPVTRPQNTHSTFASYFAALSRAQERLDGCEDDGERSDVLAHIADIRAANPAHHREEFNR